VVEQGRQTARISLPNGKTQGENFIPATSLPLYQLFTGHIGRRFDASAGKFDGAWDTHIYIGNS
jgi:hypothetical protein